MVGRKNASNCNAFFQPMSNALSPSRLAGVVPGLLLCLAVSAAAAVLQSAEAALFGRAWLEALVIAILLGAVVRTAWTPGMRWAIGINFSAKTLLEIAIVLLGATISAGTILRAGPWLLLGIVGVVFLGIGASYALGRLAGLPARMATLIACGNSICGNSAIVAVAPVIGACAEDVGASIAFTAVLGVAVVLGLPALAVALHWTPRAFGVFAGLTVYAVPQVLAATAPISSLSAQVGTFVKLVRVLMLGPVVVVLSLLARRPGDAEEGAARPSLGQIVPWFIVGFLVMVALRSTGVIPRPVLAPVGTASNALTVVSMAALGLGVDVRSIARAGVRVTAVVSLSLLILGVLAWALIASLHLGV